MIRTEIIKQAAELYKKYIESDRKNDDEITFGAYVDGQLSYCIKYIHEFDIDMILICRYGGGEAIVYTLEYVNSYGIEDLLNEAFDHFEEVYDDIMYLWCMHNKYEIGDDDEGLYVGKFCDEDLFTELGKYFELDEYEECYLLKRFPYSTDISEIYQYIDKLNQIPNLLELDAKEIYEYVKELNELYDDEDEEDDEE